MVIRRPSSLAVTIGVTLLIGLLFVLEQNAFPLQALVALPLVLFLPGYAVTLALFPRNVLESAERLLFSVGLSIGLTILGGAVLNLLPGGLRENSWSLILVAITLTASAVALARKHEPLTTTLQWRGKVRLANILQYELAVLLLMGAVWIARQPAPTSRVTGYTSLWMVPEQARSLTFTIGINSAETETTKYRLELQLSGKVFEEWDNLELAPGQVWSSSFDLSALGRQPVAALLYRTDQPNVIYRKVDFQP